MKSSTQHLVMLKVQMIALFGPLGLMSPGGARTWYHKIQVHEDSKEKAIKLRDEVLEGLQK